MPRPVPDKVVGALVNGLSILRYLQQTPTPVGVTRVARDLSLNPSTCFNLLRTLVYEGLVNFNTQTKTYTISLGIVAFAQGAMDRESHIRKLHPELERLAKQYSVAMHQWQRIDDERVLLVDSAEPEDSTVRVSMRIGQRLPVFAGAMGRCFAAYSDKPEAELREQFGSIRLAQPMGADEWLDELKAVRKKGFAVDSGHLTKGITTVSVPVFDSDARPFLAISAIVLDDQVSESAVNALASDMAIVSRQASRTAPSV
ncbi:MAG: IclR family transcriptional regulator [Burkholderiaceae bacterium]